MNHFGTPSRVALATAMIVIAGAHSASADPVRIDARQSDDYGTYIVDDRGRALYVFSRDTQGGRNSDAASTCTEACTTAWPPVTTSGQPLAEDEVVQSLLATMERPDGAVQVTYNGWPLYAWAGDEGSATAGGHNVDSFGGEWHLMAASGQPVERHATPEGGSAIEGGDLFADVAFEAPECVRYDAERDRYIVSNINGKMRDPDGNGFISLLAPDGTVIERRWISEDNPEVTLNAPKGMEIGDGVLHVADIDHLRSFDIATGEPVETVYIDGAHFLNDMAVAPDGTIYITDTGTEDIPGAVYKVTPDGTASAIAEGRQLDRPNGIDFDPDGNLVVVTYAADKVFTMSTDGEILDTQRLSAGQLDGLLVREDGSRLVTSWKGKFLARVTPDGNETVVVDGITSAAAFDIDRERNRLLIPLVNQNRLLVAPLD